MIDVLNEVAGLTLQVEAQNKSQEYLVGKAFFLGCVVGFLAGCVVAYGVFVSV